MDVRDHAADGPAALVRDEQIALAATALPQRVGVREAARQILA
jgi:hypothetical protein